MLEKNCIVKDCKALSSLGVLLLSVVIIVLLLGSAVFYFWYWPGDLETEEMNYTGFNSVEVGWAFEVTVNQGSSYSVVITADEKIINLIEVNQTENRLSIGFKAGTLIGNLFRKAEITMPKLNELILSAATEATIEEFRSSESIKIELSGASSLEITDLHVENVKLQYQELPLSLLRVQETTLKPLFQVQVI